MIGKLYARFDSSGSGYNLILRSWIDPFPELIVLYMNVIQWGI